MISATTDKSAGTLKRGWVEGEEGAQFNACGRVDIRWRPAQLRRFEKLLVSVASWSVPPSRCSPQHLA